MEPKGTANVIGFSEPDELVILTRPVLSDRTSTDSTLALFPQLRGCPPISDPSGL